MRVVYTCTHFRPAFFTAFLAALLAVASAAPQAASFGYHGTLQDAGRPAQGNYDLELTLYSAETGGRVIGGPLLLYSVPVRDGSFSTQADFGALAHVTGTAWLGVKVRSAGKGEYVALSARSPVSVDATATTTTSVCPGAWTIAGNAGNPAGSYLGTADSEPLTLKVNGSQAGQFTSGFSASFTQSPNVVLGSSGNLIGSIVVNGSPTGDTISGGGSTAMLCGPAGTSTCTNAALDQFATVSGGADNNAVGGGATVGGGRDNLAGADSATVPGGRFNSAGGMFSFAAGYKSTVRAAGIAGNSTGDEGTFAWADSQDAYFTSTGNDQFIVRSQGGVAINTTPPNHDVELTIQQSAADVSGQASLFMRQGNTTDGALLAAGGATAGNNDATFYIYNYDPAAGPQLFQELSLQGGNLTIAGTATKPGGGTWSAPSDRRIKHDVVPVANAVDTLLQLQPVSFRYNADYRAQIGGLADKAYLGFVAQDYARVFPDAVTSTNQRVPDAASGDPPILALDPNPALITTVAAVQELAVDSRAQQAEVAQLRAENADLRAALADLRTRVATLEHRGGE